MTRLNVLAEFASVDELRSFFAACANWSGAAGDLGSAAGRMCHAIARVPAMRLAARDAAIARLAGEECGDLSCRAAAKSVAASLVNFAASPAGRRVQAGLALAARSAVEPSPTIADVLKLCAGSAPPGRHAIIKIIARDRRLNSRMPLENIRAAAEFPTQTNAGADEVNAHSKLTEILASTPEVRRALEADASRVIAERQAHVDAIEGSVRQAENEYRKNSALVSEAIKKRDAAAAALIAADDAIARAVRAKEAASFAIDQKIAAHERALTLGADDEIAAIAWRARHALLDNQSARSLAVSFSVERNEVTRERIEKTLGNHENLAVRSSQLRAVIASTDAAKLAADQGRAVQKLRSDFDAVTPLSFETRLVAVRHPPKMETA